MKKLMVYILLLTCLSAYLAAQEKNSNSTMDKFKITIRNVPEMNVVYYSFVGPYDQAFNEFSSLMAYLQQNKIPLGTHSMGIFYDDPATVSADSLRSEAGFMVTKKVNTNGNYKFKTLPAGKAVTVKYTSMDDIMPAYEALGKYIKANGIKTEPYSIEIYYSPDPAVVDAEVLMMIKK